MNRRESLSRLLLTSGALATLPSWVYSWELNTLPPSNGVFSEKELALLRSVADTFIPAGQEIGALATGVDVFLASLFSQCYEPATQDAIRKQLAELEQLALTQFQKSFSECAQQDRETIVKARMTDANAAVRETMNLLKTETIRGFTTSKEVMTKYLKYKVIPGHYYGCVPVTP